MRPHRSGLELESVPLCHRGADLGNRLARVLGRSAGVDNDGVDCPPLQVQDPPEAQLVPDRWVGEPSMLEYVSRDPEKLDAHVHAREATQRTELLRTETIETRGELAPTMANELTDWALLLLDRHAQDR